MTDERLTNLAIIFVESETAETKIRYHRENKNIFIFENL